LCNIGEKKREDLTERCMAAVFFFGLTAVVLRCCRRCRCHRQSVSSLSNSKFPLDFLFCLSVCLFPHLASHLQSRSLWQKCMQQTVSLHNHCNFTIFRKPLTVCVCVCVCVCLSLSLSLSYFLHYHRALATAPLSTN